MVHEQNCIQYQYTGGSYVCCDNGLYWPLLYDLHVIARISALDNLYQTGKSPLLVRDMLVSFGHILLETNKTSSCWDNVGRFKVAVHALSVWSLLVESDGTSLSHLCFV